MASVIGHAVLSVWDNTIMLDDITQGVALYKLTGRSRIKTFPILIQKKHCSRSMALHNGGSSILSGSNHRIVYVFDRQTGDITDTINNGVKDWVQSIMNVMDLPRWGWLKKVVWGSEMVGNDAGESNFDYL
ncbi:hypothetical protein PQX77_001324 [Marasmius sp. AFHP31]|nr:hypothetical protein PQX77_001324 [Marasmius sp. AFHP31]